MLALGAAARADGASPARLPAALLLYPSVGQDWRFLVTCLAGSRMCWSNWTWATSCERSEMTKKRAE